MNELIGKYLNGYKIVKIERDPFIKGQVNLWTDEVVIEPFGDRTVTKFFVREDSNSNRIYQELIDKEKYELQQKNKHLKEVIKELNKELDYIDDGIMETCKIYDVNGIKLKKILDKVKEI